MNAFIAYRFSGEDPKELTPLLSSAVEALKQKGIESYCTLFDYDDVRDKGKSAHEIMAHAFSIIDKSDFLFVILTSEAKSEGMLMEIGYCIAKQVPIYVAVKEGVVNTYVPQTGSASFEWRDAKDLADKIKDFNFSK